MTDISSAAQTGPPMFQVPPGAAEGAAALAFFREATSAIFTSNTARESAPEDFFLEAQGWHLGALMLGWLRCSAMTFERTRAIIAAGGVDHMMIQFYAEGGFEGDADGWPIRVAPGDICVFDLTGPLRTRTTDLRCLTILVPRPFFETAIDDVYSLHGVVLAAGQPLTELLALHLVGLAERVPRLRARNAEAAARGAVAMITAILADRGRAPASGVAVSVTSRFRAIAKYIDLHLNDGALEAGAIASKFGLSRAGLYRMFEPLGGVADYIRRRRLTRAALDLAAPESRGRRIGEIAYRWGFASDAAFSRGFRDYFGVNPTQIRDQAERIWSAYSGADLSLAEARRLAGWVKGLRD